MDKLHDQTKGSLLSAPARQGRRNRVLRLVAVPLLSLGVMYLMGIRGNMLVSMVIPAAAPVATATSMFALLFGRDEQTSVNLVSVTTLLSLITMSVIVALAQTAA